MFVCELYAFMAVKHGICVAICLALRWHFNLNSSWQLQKCSIFFFYSVRLLILSINVYKNGTQIMNRKCACHWKWWSRAAFFLSLWVARPSTLHGGRGDWKGRTELHICMPNWWDWPSWLTHNGHTSIFNGHIFICRTISFFAHPLIFAIFISVTRRVDGYTRFAEKCVTDFNISVSGSICKPII